MIMYVYIQMQVYLYMRIYIYIYDTIRESAHACNDHYLETGGLRITIIIAGPVIPLLVSLSCPTEVSI